MWSAPITFGPNGGTVSLNADGVQGMHVEIANEAFAMLPDYSGANAGTATTGDGLDCPVQWPGASLAALAGQTVRLRVQLKKTEQVEPRLFAVYVK